MPPLQRLERRSYVALPVRETPADPIALQPDPVGPTVEINDGGLVALDLRGRGGVFVGADEGLLGASMPGRVVKRAMDLAIAALAVVVLSPLFAVTALLIRITSPGPVFYVQDRVGKDGRRFRFYKFRTMCHDADAERQSLEADNECAGPIFKIRRDPRITPVGRVLRKLSVDELPQLFHVITGRMSLVGPRPPLPDEVEAYGEWERQRLLIKPGITCIWQVSGRSDLDFDTWVAMDIDYMRRWSNRLDLEILTRTIPAVISGRGAY